MTLHNLSPIHMCEQKLHLSRHLDIPPLHAVDKQGVLWKAPDYIHVAGNWTEVSHRTCKYAYRAVNLVFISIGFVHQEVPRSRSWKLWEHEISDKLLVNGNSYKLDPIGLFIILKFVQKNPTKCNSLPKFYSIFKWSLTCFWRHTSHHMEPKLHKQPLTLHNTVGDS
jgi:hypothetical protein